MFNYGAAACRVTLKTGEYPARRPKLRSESTAGNQSGQRRQLRKEMKLTLEAVLQCLCSDHVQDNKFRLGALGANDIDLAVKIIEKALEKIKRADEADRRYHEKHWETF